MFLSSSILMLFRQFRRGPSYEPLPSNVSHKPSLKSKRRRVFILFGSSLVAGVLIVASHAIIYAKRPFSPLDNFQILNDLPVVRSGYEHVNSLSTTNAVVSSLYSDSYAIGVAVLGHSIRASNVSASLILPYLPDRISTRALCIARAVGWEPHAVPLISPPHNGKGIYYRFEDQYTKLNIWAFDQLGIERLVYLDADTLVRRNFDELFDIPFGFAAVEDVYSNSKGFSVNFNAGVLVIQPSTALLEDMKAKIETADYPLGEAEQAFLNLYYGGRALHLPYVYNANLAMKRRSPTLWEGLKEEMRIVHYTLVKPFLGQLRPSSTILTSQEQMEALRAAETQEEGEFADEVRWWAEAYERMQSDSGEAIARCSHL